MAIYISNRQLRHAKRMHITYDLNTLGPRQRTELSRATRTGLFKGSSVCNDIALALRRQHGLGRIWFRGWGIRWVGLGHDEFDPLNVALATSKLTNGSASMDRDAISKVEAKHSDGWIYVAKPKMPPLSLAACPALNSLVADIESGKITELTFPIDEAHSE